MSIGTDFQHVPLTSEEPSREGQTKRSSCCIMPLLVVACFACVAIVRNGGGKNYDSSIAAEPLWLASSSSQSNKTNQTKLRPVFFMHGLLGDEHAFDQVVGWLHEAHPHRLLFPIKLYGLQNSYKAPLMKQLDALVTEIRGIIGVRPDAFNDGYDLMCHSQGALLCRVLCQVMDDHKVHTLVSLAGPHMGVYGATWFKEFDPNPVRIPGISDALEDSQMLSFYLVAYTSTSQQSTSVANLWHDPLHEDLFVKESALIPFVNGMIGPVPAGMKENFVRLKKTVFLVGSFSDREWDSKTGLEPWCTGNFAFYAAGAPPGTPCVPMEKQDFFIKDTFGLKSLHDAGRLHVQSVADVEHGEWLTSKEIFSKFVLPHLS